jgi:hypothetical protein
MRIHSELDARSLRMHQLVADKVRRDPALLDRARQTLAHWRQTVNVRTQPYLAEWEQLMGQGINACLAAAVENSEKAQALRQCSPLAGLLSNQERFAFLKAWSQEHAPQ